MYRIVGCILVVVAGAGMGFSGSMRLSEQIRILEKLLQMVICLKGEIRCGNASLPDAFYGAAGRMNGKYREFLISAADRMKAGTGEKLSQICRECAESALKKSCLTHGEKDAFFSFGEYLGYMDLEMQMRQLSLYENNLEAEIPERKNCTRELGFLEACCLRFSWYSIVYQTVVRRTGFQKKRRDHLEVSIIFKIGAVGILVSVLSQILKHSGREEQAFLVSFSGLLLVLFWIVPYIYELFKNIQQLFVL